VSNRCAQCRALVRSGTLTCSCTTVRSVQPGAIRGAFLIEALVAILVVSIAITGLFALMANLIRASGDALLRAEAAEIAAAAVARIAAENPASLTDRYATPESAGFAVLASAAQRLPGVTRTANLPTVSVTDGPSLGTRRVVVGVQWQAPTAPTPHRASMTTIVGP